MSVKARLQAINDTIAGVKVEEDVSEWTVDMTLYCLAKLIEAFGLDGSDNMFEAIMTPDNAEEMGAKLGDFFVPPKYIRDTPFPDAIKIWWEAVADILKAGDAFDEKQKPNYRAVASAWKNKIADRYGFRPTAEKDKTFADAVEDGVKQAASAMAKARQGGPVDQDALSKAARYMASKSKRRMGPAAGPKA